MAGRVETTAGIFTSCALAGAQVMNTAINNRKAGRSRRTIKFISTPPISNSVGGRDYCEPICCTNCREEYNKWANFAIYFERKDELPISNCRFQIGNWQLAITLLFVAKLVADTPDREHHLRVLRVLFDLGSQAIDV